MDAYRRKCELFDNLWYAISNMVQFRLKQSLQKTSELIEYYIKVINHRIWDQMDKMSMNRPLFRWKCRWFTLGLYNSLGLYCDHFDRGSDHNWREPVDLTTWQWLILMLHFTSKYQVSHSEIKMSKLRCILKDNHTTFFVRFNDDISGDVDMTFKFGERDRKAMIKTIIFF